MRVTVPQTYSCDNKNPKREQEDENVLKGKVSKASSVSEQFKASAGG